MQQKFISVCSGIEAVSEAWMPLGWEPLFYSEIEKFPAAVLEHRHPEVPNLGDMTKFKEWSDYDADVLVGGTPCQSFSVAGLRKGLDDPRGNLMLTYLAIAGRYRPTWLVWENVPGVLSSNGGRDFGTFLWALGQLGYGWSYRVLDAQYFGVPQRRRRVFVVGCLGGWQRAAAVLFESESMCGNPAPRREKRTEVAGTIARGSFSGGPGGRPEGAAGNHFLPVIETCPTLDASFGRLQGCSGQDSNHGHGHLISTAMAFAQNTRDEVRLLGGDGQIAGALGANEGMKQRTYLAEQTTPWDCQEKRIHSIEGASPTLAGSDGGGGRTTAGYYFMPDMAVRRLTPVECERLQGFPDNHTLIPWRNKPAENCPDGPRYKALGNSMAVPVMKWIGERIEAVENVVREREVA